MAFHLRRQQRILDTTEFTPISTRGKKRQRSHVPSTISSQEGTSQTPSSRPCSAGSIASNPAPKRQQRTKTLSSIELLPPEIMANIFSYTCNINFPRASPILASKLTGEHIYYEFCKRLFCSFELRTFPPKYTAQSGVNHTYQCYSGTLDVDEEKDLVPFRMMALTCKWMTLERFKRCREEIIAEKRECHTSFPVGSMKRVREGRYKIELWLGRDFTLPTLLLRYPSNPDPEHRSRGLGLLNYVLCTYQSTLDPYSDGDERCRHLWAQAIAAKDYRTLFSLCHAGLLDEDWISDLRPALKGLDNCDLVGFHKFIENLRRWTWDTRRAAADGKHWDRIDFFKCLQAVISELCADEEHITWSRTSLSKCWHAFELMQPGSPTAEGRTYYQEWFTYYHDANKTWEEFRDWVGKTMSECTHTEQND